MNSNPSPTYEIKGIPTEAAALHLMDQLIRVGDRPEAVSLCDSSKMLRQLGKWLRNFYTDQQIEKSGLIWYETRHQIQLFHKSKLQFTITFYR